MGIDIISNSKFIKTNEIFQAITKQVKKEGRGEIESKNAINDQDMSKLNTYFITNMQGPPNAKLLQEIVLFNIIYYGGRRGYENLRSMTKDTFKILRDGDGHQYIKQVVKEFDKNHHEDDLTESNEARIYEQPGKLKNNVNLSKSQWNAKLLITWTNYSKYSFYLQVLTSVQWPLLRCT